MFLALLIKYGPSLAIYILQKTGVLNEAEVVGIKAGTHVLQAVESIKTYSAPSDFPDESTRQGV